jgi:2'-5' RNA ligase
MRLFVAIDLPGEVSRGLSRLSSGLPGARWVRQEQLHLTLRFIGEVDGGRFRDIREELGGVSLQPFSLQLDGLGVFPPRGRPRVVWAGLRQSKPLLRLRNQVESALVRAGLARETRKFAPHVTLARLKNTPAVRVGRYLEQWGLYASRPFTVERFFLYSSQLGHSGALHTIEAEYPLAA